MLSFESRSVPALASLGSLPRMRAEERPWHTQTSSALAPQLSPELLRFPHSTHAHQHLEQTASITGGPRGPRSVQLHAYSVFSLVPKIEVVVGLPWEEC